jgi:phage shock protein C
MTCPNCQKPVPEGSNFCCNCGAKQFAAADATPPQNVHVKRLVRSTNDRKIAGVCAGIADYFDLDPTIVRVIWLLATMIPGPNIIAYLVLWLALPEGQTRTYPRSAAASS